MTRWKPYHTHHTQRDLGQCGSSCVSPGDQDPFPILSTVKREWAPYSRQADCQQSRESDHHRAFRLTVHHIAGRLTMNTIQQAGWQWAPCGLTVSTIQQAGWQWALCRLTVSTMQYAGWQRASYSRQADSEHHAAGWQWAPCSRLTVSTVQSDSEHHAACMLTLVTVSTMQADSKHHTGWQ